MVIRPLHLVVPRSDSASNATNTVPALPTPNYVDPQTRAPFTLGIVCSIGTVMVLLMASRIYSHRFVTQRGLDTDDWLMLLASVIALVVVVLVCVTLKYGSGYHVWDIPAAWNLPFGKAIYGVNITFMVATSLTKISILCTYIRVFPNRANRVFCYSTGSFLAVFCLVHVIVSLSQCRPIAANWDWGIAKFNCINLDAYVYASGTINCITDVVVYLWPSRTLFLLQLPLGKRLGLLAIFSSGLIATAAGILRMIVVHELSISSDSTYVGALDSLAVTFEVCFGVICGCLAAVKPLIGPHIPHNLRSSADRTHRTVPSGHDLKSFKHLDNVSSQAGVEVEADTETLQEHVPPGHISVKTEIHTKVSGNRHGDGDSEEWIMSRDEASTKG